MVWFGFGCCGAGGCVWLGIAAWGGGVVWERWRELGFGVWKCCFAVGLAEETEGARMVDWRNVEGVIDDTK